MGSALPAIDALPSCDAISKAPRAAGYRGSDFVQWHLFPVDGSWDGRSTPKADEGNNGEIDEVDGASQGIEVP